jgi:hypothetical protein
MLFKQQLYNIQLWGKSIYVCWLNNCGYNTRLIIFYLRYEMFRYGAIISVSDQNFVCILAYFPKSIYSISRFLPSYRYTSIDLYWYISIYLYKSRYNYICRKSRRITCSQNFLLRLCSVPLNVEPATTARRNSIERTTRESVTTQNTARTLVVDGFRVTLDTLYNSRIPEQIIACKLGRKRSLGRPLKRWHKTVTCQWANT